jgi:hypothetical protein
MVANVTRTAQREQIINRAYTVCPVPTVDMVDDKIRCRATVLASEGVTGERGVPLPVEKSPVAIPGSTLRSFRRGKRVVCGVALLSDAVTMTYVGRSFTRSFPVTGAVGAPASPTCRSAARTSLGRSGRPGQSTSARIGTRSLLSLDTAEPGTANLADVLVASSHELRLVGPETWNAAFTLPVTA